MKFHNYLIDLKPQSKNLRRTHQMVFDRLTHNCIPSVREFNWSHFFAWCGPCALCALCALWAPTTTGYKIFSLAMREQMCQRTKSGHWISQKFNHWYWRQSTMTLFTPFWQNLSWHWLWPQSDKVTLAEQVLLVPSKTLTIAGWEI